MKKTDPVSTYIAQFPKDIQKRLADMRRTIQKVAPDATEKIGYGIPTFVCGGNLVHFAAFKNHIGFYPGPSGIAQFMETLSAYKVTKGTIQFGLDQPLPLGLVQKIVRFRLKENLAKTKKKRPRSPSKASSRPKKK